MLIPTLNTMIRVKVDAHSQEIFYLIKFIYFKISKIVFVVMKYMNEYSLYSMYLLWHIRNLYTSMYIQCTYYDTFVTYTFITYIHQCMFNVPIMAHS